MRRRRSGLNFGRRKKKVNMTIVKEILSWTVEILITLVIAFTFVYFIGLRTSVVGQSMSETLESGDEILVNRFIYKVSDPKPNDIIVFLPNGNEKSHYYVKRVIAVPGDTVLIQNGAVYVNGELFDEKVDVSAIEEAGLASEERDEEEESEQDDADGLPEPSAGRSAADERIERAEHESQPEGLKRHLRNPGLYVAVQRRGERQFEGKQVFCVLGPCLRFLFGAVFVRQ